MTIKKLLEIIGISLFLIGLLVCIVEKLIYLKVINFIPYNYDLSNGMFLISFIGMLILLFTIIISNKEKEESNE